MAAAIEGFGILYILEDLLAAPLADGRLICLLEPWCEPFAGYHLYYPNRNGTTAFELFKEYSVNGESCEKWPYPFFRGGTKICSLTRLMHANRCLPSSA